MVEHKSKKGLKLSVMHSPRIQLQVISARLLKQSKEQGKYCFHPKLRV